MSEKYEKTYKYLNYVKNLFVLVLAVTSCVSIFAFASSVCVPVSITSYAMGLNICEACETLFRRVIKYLY